MGITNLASRIANRESSIGLIVSQCLVDGHQVDAVLDVPGYSGCKKAMPTPARLAASAGSWKWDLGVGSCLLGAGSWKLRLATASEDLLPR